MIIVSDKQRADSAAVQLDEERKRRREAEIRASLAEAANMGYRDELRRASTAIASLRHAVRMNATRSEV